MRHTRTIRLGAVPVLLSLAMTVGAHTLFLKPDSFFVPPGGQMVIPLVNGTFHENENKVAVARMAGARVINPDGTIIPIDEQNWSVNKENLTLLNAKFEEAGNYVIGVGTKPMKVRLSSDEFNFYLRYEGLADDTNERKALDEQAIAAAEEYTKYSKAIVQVGDEQTTNFSQLIGHPIEIVPLQNPYALKVGDSLSVRVLKNGEPLTDELVYASNEDHQEVNSEGVLDELVAVRTNSEGLAQIPIDRPGRWYVRTIELTRLSDSEYWYSGILVKLGVEEQRISYESSWATLTFEVR